MFGFDRFSKMLQFVLAGIAVAGVLNGCGGPVSPAAFSPSNSAASSEAGNATRSLPPGGRPASNAPLLNAKAACQAFNAGLVEYRDGAKDAGNTNWLLLGAKLIDQGKRSPAEVAGPLNALSDLAYARADANGETAPSDQENTVPDAVLKAKDACTAVGVTLEM